MKISIESENNIISLEDNSKEVKSQEALVEIGLGLLATAFIALIVWLLYISGKIAAEEMAANREYLMNVFDGMSKENFEKLIKVFKDSADSYDDAGDELEYFFKYKIIQKMHHADPNSSYNIFIDRHYPRAPYDSIAKQIVKNNVDFSVDELTLTMMYFYLITTRTVSGRIVLNGFDIDILDVYANQYYNQDQLNEFHYKMRRVLESRDTTIQMERLFKNPEHVKLNPKIVYIPARNSDYEYTSKAKVTCKYSIEPDRSYINSLIKAVTNDIASAENKMKRNVITNSMISKSGLNKSSKTPLADMIKSIKL